MSKIIPCSGGPGPDSRDGAGLGVCGEAGDAEQALRDIPGRKPDLVLVDITLPGRSGLDLIKELRAADRDPRILVVSMHDEALYADRVLRAGGDGYIMKQEEPGEDRAPPSTMPWLDGYCVQRERHGRVKAPGNPVCRTSPAALLERMADQELEILHLLGNGETRRNRPPTWSETSGLGHQGLRQYGKEARFEKPQR